MQPILGPNFVPLSDAVRPKQLIVSLMIKSSFLERERERERALSSSSSLLRPCGNVMRQKDRICSIRSHVTQLY